MISRQTRALLCFVNKAGWFRMVTVLAGGIFVAGGIYATTLSRVEALEQRAAAQDGYMTQQDYVNRQLLQDVAWIKGFLKQKLGGGE